jgi:hypothetical protein
MYDRTEKWLCGHSGNYRDERDHDLSPRKRRPNRHHPSVKVNCAAYFFLRKVCGEDRVKIEYGWEHDGHEPGTVKDMAGSMLPLRVKEWIDNRVAEGLDRKTGEIKLPPASIFMNLFQDTPHYKIDTNTYVESWHHHLKLFYLKLMRKRRVDVLLHILTEQVEPDFRRSDIRIALDFERPRLSKSEQASQQKAKAIVSKDLDDMIDYAEVEADGTSKVIVSWFLKRSA